MEHAKIRTIRRALTRAQPPAHVHAPPESGAQVADVCQARTYMHPHTYTPYTHIHTYNYKRGGTETRDHTHTLIHTHTLTLIHTHTLTHLNTHTHTYTQTHSQTHTHTNKHSQTHVHTNPLTNPHTGAL